MTTPTIFFLLLLVYHPSRMTFCILCHPFQLIVFLSLYLFIHSSHFLNSPVPVQTAWGTDDQSSESPYSPFCDRASLSGSTTIHPHSLGCHIWQLYIHIQGFNKNNGNTTDTINISLLMWRWTTFCLQYSCNPSWNGLIQLLNFSSCFIDVGGGNLFLTLVSRTDQSDSMTFKYGDCAGQGRC